MTDLQEALIWGHPRDDEGRLIPPRRPAPVWSAQTLDEEMAAAAAIMAALGVSADDQRRAESVIRAGHEPRG